MERAPTSYVGAANVRKLSVTIINARPEANKGLDTRKSNIS
jgi:hypothetical protein